MKYIIWFIITFSLMSGYSQESAYLTIHSSPPNVKIRLDSILIGETPLAHLAVEQGKHHIEALSPYSGLWNLDNINKTFSIKSGHDTTISIHFQKQVKINSIPFHAQLSHKNQGLGLTPVTIPFEENRGKEFQLEKKGYKSKNFILREQNSYLFKLEPLTMEATQVERNSFTYSLFHSRLKTKFLFLAGTVTTHWLAFYLKNVADDNYNKYNKTADPNLMDKYWDRTQKYDRWSDITLGVSYAFLSGLIYTVLWR